jgi:signal transduction histidine kinase/PAS domain-containing protein
MYYRFAGDSQLAAIGILAFAAIAQLAPAFFIGLIWRNATARGAIGGMTVGILTWAYTLLLPTFADNTFLTAGPWSIDWLRPQHLFGMELPPLVHGVMWSLLLNIVATIGFSTGRAPSAIERMQADVFVPTRLAPMTPSFRLWRSSVTVEELTSTVARYLGEERTRSSFESFAAARRINLQPDAEADFQLLRYAEHQLASAIGAASSRLVLSLLLRKRTVSTQAALKLLDDANAAIHYNREILQTALDHVRQGIAVYDKDMRLVCWNRQFGEILDLPPELTRTGVTLEEIVRHNAKQGALGPGPIDILVRERLAHYVSESEPYLKRFPDRGLVVEIRTNRMPDGGIVTTATDITPSVVAAEALERANATLEMRVRERTTELTRLNAELGRAKGDAEEANVSKTRFLAAASHDILQPLNAARLYVTSLMEREGDGENARLIGNVDASLDAVEEIFGALLDISRLDTGAMRAEFVSFRIDEMLRQLEVEFSPLAREKGLDLQYVPCSLTVRSDRRLLRRLLQNLVSNAIKYTPKGRVLFGCRLRGGNLRIDVYDTGLGIPASKKKIIFREFHRLDEGAKVARGLGLGLSIVQRIGRVLDHKIDLVSVPGRGSRFSVEVPLSSAAPSVQAPREFAAVDRGGLIGTTVLCIDNEPKVLDGMDALLGGWGCRVLKAPDLATAVEAIVQSQATPSGLLVDYHLDKGNGLDAIIELRRRFGAELPAILITADRSPHVRDAAREQDVQVLSKPLKPAALRALMAQWRLPRIAAAE